MIRIPDEIDSLRRTVSVLGNNDLDLVGNGRGGRGLIVAVRVVFFVLVIFLTVEHEDYIRILLNRARFTQIGQLRTVGFSPALGASGELGAADDGDIHFDEKEGLPGKIVISTFLGDFIEYEIELDNGQTVQLNEYTKDVRELRPDGQRVKVNFDINAVGVYDAGTQEVISW